MPYLEESWLPIANTLGFETEEAMLKHLYLEQRLSLSQLAKIVGYSTFTVRERLVRNLILLRGRGGAHGGTAKRSLSHVSDDQLFKGEIKELVLAHNVHPSTICSERRYRRKIKASQLEVVK